MAKDPSNSILQNRDHLFTFLTALVKKNGGVLVLTEDEITNVEKNDLVSVKYDVEAKEIIFEVTSLSDTSGYSAEVKSRKDN
jgi:hypothetical protein|tara:strand:- start:1020 stop:1265 length:246 start_codon:yes stop_codon:yes gene_type:complete